MIVSFKLLVKDILSKGEMSARDIRFNFIIRFDKFPSYGRIYTALASMEDKGEVSSRRVDGGDGPPIARWKTLWRLAHDEACL